MNKAILTGRIANDLELRQTNSGKLVCEFTIAVRRDQDSADFIRCVVWGKQAENLTAYQKKGNLIGVEGANRVDTYDGNDGKRRYKSYIFVNSIEYLERREQTAEPQPEPQTEPQPEPQQFTFGDPDEIPF